MAKTTHKMTNEEKKKKLLGLIKAAEKEKDQALLDNVSYTFKAAPILQKAGLGVNYIAQSLKNKDDPLSRELYSRIEKLKAQSDSAEDRKAQEKKKNAELERQDLIIDELRREYQELLIYCLDLEAQINEIVRVDGKRGLIGAHTKLSELFKTVEVYRGEIAEYDKNNHTNIQENITLKLRGYENFSDPSSFLKIIDGGKPNEQK